MSFKVKDLSVSLSGLGYDDYSTCTTQTKPSCINSIFWQDGAASRQRNLVVLRAELRNSLQRA